MRGANVGYYLSTIVAGNFQQVLARVTDELGDEGFGVLTDIDVQETLKKKLDVDFRQYRILGACNPPFAHQALLAEDKIGVLLPCNVIVQERGPGEVEVAAMDPAAAMESIANDRLHEVAEEVRRRLKAVLDRL
jgi:uncharacterized protein (DUF302 family)